MEANQISGGPQPPPGWYSDPQAPGQQRYWDGERWTEQVSPQVTPPPPGPPPPVGGAQHGPSSPAQGPPGGPAFQPASDADARQWALFAHLSALIGIVLFGLTFLGPLIIYLTKKDDHPFIAEQAREALNFNLSVLIYEVVGTIAAVILSLVLIGLLLFPVLIGIAIAWLVFVIIAAVKVNSGEAYRYPLTLRMVS